MTTLASNRVDVVNAILRQVSTALSHFPKRLWPTLLLFVLGASWGLHVSVVKLASHSGLGYGPITALTTFGVAGALVVVALVRRKLPSFRRPALVYYAVCAVLGYLAPFFVQVTVAPHLPAGGLAIILATTPIWTTLIAWIARSETLARRHIMGIGVGFTAAAILLVPGAPLGKALDPSWALAAFAVPLTYAAYHVYVARAWPHGLGSFQVGAGEALAGFLIVLPACLLADGTAVSGIWTEGAWTIPVLVLITVLSVFLYFEINRLAGAVFVAQAGYIAVVCGLFWGMAIFGEPLTPGLGASAALLVVSLYLTRAEKPGT